MDSPAPKLGLAAKMNRFAIGLAVTLAAVACDGPTQSSTPTPTPTSEGVGLHKIQHVVVIMQENRSFDHYFGLYPGADGLPRQGGQFTVCVPDPDNGSCVRPYHDPQRVVELSAASVPGV